MRGTRAKVVIFFCMLGAMIAVGCNALLDFDSFTYDPSGSEAGGDTTTTEGGGDAGDGGCIDPTGFGGKGCYRCAPTTNDQLLNACTNAKFETFDNAMRIQGFDPNNPRPPLVDGGPTPPPFDAGVVTPTDSGVDPVPPCEGPNGNDGPLFTRPNPVIVFGATGFPMDVIAKAMGSDVTMFYREEGSCVGWASMLLNAPKAGDTGKEEVTYFDNTTGVGTRCTLASSHPADVNLAALFAETCAGQNGLPPNVSVPADVQDFLGPANPVMFAVPATSKERVISAEAAYKVYGFGNASGVAPWTDEFYIFRRTPSSGNQQSTARSILLPPDALRGRDSAGSSNMRRALQQSDKPDITIGISSSEIIDINRDVMKSLAYQHYNQAVGFYPDSDPGQFDRRNVRDGHYFMWIPLHVMVKTVAGDPISAQNTVLDPDGSKKATRDAAVKKLVFVMVNRQEPPVKSVNMFNALKVIGNIPQCAMRVTRTKEAAPLEPFTPSTSCACAFEAASPGSAPAECKPCTGPADCAGSSKPTCSFGFCE